MSNLEVCLFEGDDDELPIETPNSNLVPLEQWVTQILDYSSKYNSSQSRFYAPENLIGKYENYPAYGDSTSTYLLRSYGPWWKNSEGLQKEYLPNNEDPYGAEDFVTVLFKHAVIPRDIVIYETYNPGAVVRIWGRLTGQRWILLYQGAPKLQEPECRQFKLKITKMNKLIDQLRLEFNQSIVQYYTSVDAILLAGLQPKTALMYDVLVKCIYPLSKPKSTVALENEEETMQVSTRPDMFTTMPVEVIVHILKYLNLHTLTRCAQVNRRLRDICSDPTLYQSLSLKRYWHKVTGKTLDHFKGRCSLLRKLDLSWCGDMDGTIGPAFSELLKECGHTLTHLSLGNCDFIAPNHLNEIGEICTELVELRFRNRQLGGGWVGLMNTNLHKLITIEFFNCDIDTSIVKALMSQNANLQHFVFDLCESSHMDYLVEVATRFCKNVITWSSWKTKHFTKAGVLYFSSFPRLRELDLGWSLMLADPGDSLALIAQNCPDLRRLILSGWRILDDTDLLPIIYQCKQLRQIELVGLKSITTDICTLALHTLLDLELIDASYCDVPDTDVIEMRRFYPAVTIQKSYDVDRNVVI